MKEVSKEEYIEELETEGCQSFTIGFDDIRVVITGDEISRHTRDFLQFHKLYKQMEFSDFVEQVEWFLMRKCRVEDITYLYRGGLLFRIKTWCRVKVLNRYLTKED